jgi:hypothetical protein
MDYFLETLFSYAVYGGAVGAVSVTIVATSGANTTSIVQALTNSISTRQIDDFNLAVGGGNSPFIQTVYTISASAPLPAGVTLELDIRDSFSVAYPFDNPLASGTIVSHPGLGLYNTVASSDTWGTYYGTQLFFNSLADKDHSLVGYIDNSISDEVSIIGVVGVLKDISDKDLVSMKLVDDDDTDFQLAYRGVDGFKTLISDMLDKGLAAFLWNQGIMNATGGGLPVKSAKQVSIFDRLLYMIQGIVAKYTFGDPEIVSSVNRILSPSTI